MMNFSQSRKATKTRTMPFRARYDEKSPFYFLLNALILITCFSCSNSPEDMIPHVSGYWEIEKVILEDGRQRDYGINLTIDYISINDSLQGFRKKLQPNLVGGFVSSKDSENLSIETKNGQVFIHYKTLYNTWKEQVLLANENQLKLVNDSKTTYIYKRFTPINLN